VYTFTLTVLHIITELLGLLLRYFYANVFFYLNALLFTGDQIPGACLNNSLWTDIYIINECNIKIFTSKRK